MKVVINKCYGGYGFDPFTVQKYADEKGIKLYWYKRDTDSEYQFPEIKYNAILFDDILKDKSFRMWYTPMTKNIGESFIVDIQDDNNVLSKNEFSIYNWETEEQSRTDPVLIGVLEKYGELNTYGCHNPQVIEIPDDVEWVVDEYDGYESLHEKHRIFG